LRGTPDVVLTLECKNLHVIKWWMDASFACHPDMRRQTGAIMSFGKGAAYAMSICQKLNTRSLTEAELVAVNDILPQILWTRNFVISQGLEMHENTLLQDNRSECSYKVMDMGLKINKHVILISGISLSKTKLTKVR
jgi:ABC-type transport system involved in Fe-S cluster assembly fused permease/ATPase subunit